MIVVWDIAPYSVVEVYGRFKGVFCVHHQGDECSWILAFEISVNCLSKRRKIPEDSRRTLHRKNVKSHINWSVYEQSVVG
jgi:hypothetical protein